MGGLAGRAGNAFDDVAVAARRRSTTEPIYLAAHELMKRHNRLGRGRVCVCGFMVERLLKG